MSGELAPHPSAHFSFRCARKTAAMGAIHPLKFQALFIRTSLSSNSSGTVLLNSAIYGSVLREHTILIAMFGQIHC